MDIKLNNLSITNYDSNDIEKVKFMKELDDDILIKKYLYSDISIIDVVKKSEKISNLSLGCGYIVKDNKKFVGFIRLYRENIFSLGIDYCVHFDHRSEGYGTKILIEVSDYFLEHYRSIHNIKLNIANSNELSLKCANNAGFTLMNDDIYCQYKTFIKRKTK